KRRKTHFLSLLICSGGIAVILLGALVGSLWLRNQTDVHAANVGIQATQALQDAQAGIMPMVPMPGMASVMKNGQLARPQCLNSIAPPLCYSPQQIRQVYGIQPLLLNGVTGKGRVIT